jgi:2-C-methyl-D-erythritol 4-phosphate cytidylyltransferase/2-C-methyl-D-erythritol 2,4-cyclodiphosphate synthase
VDNLKITTIDDLKKAKEYKKMEKDFKVPDIRTGIGYDVHRLIPGDGVILCGIKLASDKKLDGHSDADVALHALTDALLGTIADGDIGNHFPPSDAVWSGADSDRFLAHACALVREKNGVITHLDVTIICEEPKVGPHRDAMRKSVADICGIDQERVSVKATTHERIGTIGRGEGIAAMATASVVIMA